MNFMSFYLTMGCFTLVLVMAVGMRKAQSDDDDPLGENEWKDAMRAYFDQRYIGYIILATILMWPAILLQEVMRARRPK